MAELRSSLSCCTTEQQQACCGPNEKAGCCGREQACGCDAGAGTNLAIIPVPVSAPEPPA
jgi:hypothetical protein